MIKWAYEVNITKYWILQKWIETVLKESNLLLFVLSGEVLVLSMNCELTFVVSSTAFEDKRSICKWERACRQTVYILLKRSCYKNSMQPVSRIAGIRRSVICSGQTWSWYIIDFKLWSPHVWLDHQEFFNIQQTNWKLNFKYSPPLERNQNSRRACGFSSRLHVGMQTIFSTLTLFSLFKILQIFSFPA